MNYILTDKEPKLPLKYFEDISAIPHGSYNEKAISAFIADTAAKLGLYARVDERNNVVVKKPATPGYEHLPALLLQAHVDMVNEKNSDSDHDFTKDGLKLILEGNILRADGTTVFTETIFQNRYRHVNEMARMGARVRTEGKVAIVTGVPRLHGASVRCTDLRGGAALCAAALAAEGQSVIAEIHHIERGYEHLDESLRQLGANITRSDHETEAEETQTEQPTTSEEGAGA